MSNSVREVIDKVDTLGKLLLALVVVAPIAFASWAAEKPLRRMVPIFTIELLIVAALAHYAGVLPL